MFLLHIVFEIFLHFKILFLSLSLSLSLSSVVESKRSPGLAAVWVARNKFAVLDKNHQVNCPSSLLLYRVLPAFGCI